MTDNVAFVSEQIARGVYTTSLRHKGRSFIWNIFSEIIKEDGTILEGWVHCHSCFNLLKYDGRQTTNLNKHKCCLALKQPGELKKTKPLDKSNAIDACMAWVVDACLPLSAVNKSGFVKLANFFIRIGASYGENIDINDLLPDPERIVRKLQKTANEKKEELMNEINEVVKTGGASATIDMWSDNDIKRNFFGVTLHYVKDYKIFDIVLGTKSMDFEKSTSENTLKKLRSLFGEYGVHNIKSIKFITDREKNIVKALEHNTRFNCNSHLLANVLDKSFDETAELTEIIESCKKIVKYLKKENLQYRLRTSLKSHYLKRWNSNYTMLRSIADNWRKINEILTEKKGSQQLLNINISTIEVLVDLCEDFEIIFKKLQLYNSPSLCFVLPSIDTIKSICAPNNEDVPAISVLKDKIIRNTDNIWLKHLNLWHKTALFLYPPAASIQQNDLSDIKKFINANIQNSGNNAATSSSNTTSTKPSQSTNSDYEFFFKDLLEKSSLPSEEVTTDEVERYSKEKVQLTDNFDLIGWWRINSGKYPRLTNFALQIHSIPASSAAAERSYLLAGNIITEKRNRRVPKTVDSLLFLHSYDKNFKK